MKTKLLRNNKNLSYTVVAIAAFTLLLVINGNLFADGGYLLPDERRELINGGAIGSRVTAEVREREIVDKGNEIWCELMSGVRTNLYVTLVFSKSDFEQNYTVADRMNISCVVTGLQKEEHQAAAGGITTYYLTCKPENDSGYNSAENIKIYQLFDYVEEADIDESFIQNIDTQSAPYPVSSFSQIGDLPIIDGASIVYKFISTYWGNSSVTGSKEIFHDILIIKTDYNNRIQEGYQYTLEWTDSPSEDLFQITNTGIKLYENINAEKLGLQNYYGELEESAIIDNIFLGQKMF